MPAPPPGRRTLATSGLWPQAYGSKQLEDMGMSVFKNPFNHWPILITCPRNFKELSQVDPRTAPFYAFTAHSCPLPNPPDSCLSFALGRSAVLEELHAKGCMLATQVWIDNHWPLILWKLAGMVALDPMSENDPFMKRWCWTEVIRQLMYRSADSSERLELCSSNMPSDTNGT